MARIFSIPMTSCAIQSVPVNFNGFCSFFNYCYEYLALMQSFRAIFVKVINCSKHYRNFVKKVPLKASLTDSSRWWLKQCISIDQCTSSFILTPSPLCMPVLTLTLSISNTNFFYFQFINSSFSNASKTQALNLSPWACLTFSTPKNFTDCIPLPSRNKT